MATSTDKIKVGSIVRVRTPGSKGKGVGKVTSINDDGRVNVLFTHIEGNDGKLRKVEQEEKRGPGRALEIYDAALLSDGPPPEPEPELEPKPKPRPSDDSRLEARELEGEPELEGLEDLDDSGLEARKLTEIDLLEDLEDLDDSVGRAARLFDRPPPMKLGACITNYFSRTGTTSEIIDVTLFFYDGKPALKFPHHHHEKVHSVVVIPLINDDDCEWQVHISASDHIKFESTHGCASWGKYEITTVERHKRKARKRTWSLTDVKEDEGLAPTKTYEELIKWLNQYAKINDAKQVVQSDGGFVFGGSLSHNQPAAAVTPPPAAAQPEKKPDLGSKETVQQPEPEGGPEPAPIDSGQPSEAAAEEEIKLIMDAFPGHFTRTNLEKQRNAEDTDYYNILDQAKERMAKKSTGGGKKTKRRKSTRRKSTRRKSTRRKSRTRRR